MQLKISNQSLALEENIKTYFDADEASGQTSLSADGAGFAVDDYVLLGQLGKKKSEIVKLHAATAPTTTAITTASATTFAHSRGEPITYLPYNQIVVEYSTNSGTTWTPLVAVNIQADSLYTYVQRPSDLTTYYYRSRFYNSNSNVYSDYSDTALATGYPDNSVYSIKERALDDLGEEKDDLITDSWLNSALWEGRRELDSKQLKWNWRVKWNQDVGDIIPGRWSITAPTDLRDPNSNSNILSLRLGRDNTPIDYQDSNTFWENYSNVAHTTLNGAVLEGAASMTLTSSGDFDESGTLYVAAEDAILTNDVVTYTANAESTGVLSGVSGALAHATGRDVWQNVTFGQPTTYTIQNGVIYFNLPFSDDLAGENIYMDYYSELVAYDSDADTLDEPDYDMYVSWLKWKIKNKKANGQLKRTEDSDWQDWNDRTKLLVERNILGQEINLIPDYE